MKVRASDAERAERHAKARSAGLTLSDLVRRSLGRARTWTVPHAEAERERTREVARLGNNLNQIVRWAKSARRQRTLADSRTANDRHPLSQRTSPIVGDFLGVKGFSGPACLRS